MAFNGSGLFQRLYSWVNDAANSINIRADRMDAEMDGIASGLSNCITRDGQGKPSTAMDWNGQNLANVNALGAASVAATGSVMGASGTFAGPVSGTTGTFSGPVSGTTGTFTSSLSAISAAVTGAFTGGSAALTGAVTAATGAFSSGLTVPTPATGNRSTSVATTQMFANEFAASLPGSSSWQKFPSGLIVQYGSAGTAGSGYVRVSFPIAFPTAATAVFCTGNGSDFTNMTFQVIGMTTAGVDVRSATGGNTPLAVSFNWIAFGY